MTKKTPSNNPSGHYYFVTSCTGSTYEDIREMLDEHPVTEVTRQTFAKAIGPEQWKDIQTQLGYDRHMPISKDWHVYYMKATYRGVPCYFLRHSGIEHIFTLDGAVGPSIAGTQERFFEDVERKTGRKVMRGKLTPDGFEPEENPFVEDEDIVRGMPAAWVKWRRCGEVIPAEVVDVTTDADGNVIRVLAREERGGSQRSFRKHDPDSVLACGAFLLLVGKHLPAQQDVDELRRLYRDEIMGKIYRDEIMGKNLDLVSENPSPAERSLDEAIAILKPLAELRRPGQPPLYRKHKGGLVVKTSYIHESMDIRSTLLAAVPQIPWTEALKSGSIVYTIPPPADWWRYTYDSTREKWR